MVDALREALDNQHANYIAPFFWQHGEPDDILREELDKIRASGIRCVCVESRPHEDFCGPGWWEDMALILAECRRLGMTLWLLDDKHFPSGYAGGALEGRSTDLRRWEIIERHADVIGPFECGALMAEGWLEGDDDEIIGVYACHRAGGEAHAGRVVDVSAGLAEGMVYLSLPEGMWRIVFLIKTRRGMTGRSGLYCDPLSGESMQVFVDAVYETHYTHFGGYFGDTFRGFFSDEPRFGNMNGQFMPDMGTPHVAYPWRDELTDMLKERLGEGALCALPALWFDIGQPDTARMRIAYMDIITGLYQKNYSEKLGGWCRAHGVLYTGHIIEDMNAHEKTGCSAGHFFRSMEGQDHAGIDVVLHQIMPGMIDLPNATRASYKHTDPEFFCYTLAKLGASLAHLGTGKHGRAMCEMFGAYGWAEGLKMMKWLTDHMLVRGINLFVPHAFSPKYPDPDCPPHFYARGNNPQYRSFKILMDYMNRMAHVLSGGTHVADAAILYDAEASWSGAPFMRMQRPAKTLYDHHIDYDFIPADYLERAHAKDGQLCIAQERFSFFVIPYAKCLPIAVIKKAYELSMAGVPVVYVGGMPSFCPEGVDIGGYIMPSDRLRCLALDDLPDYLRSTGLCDITLKKHDRYLRVYHIKKRGGDVYMLFNEHINDTVVNRIALPSAGSAYLEYDAMANAVHCKPLQDGCAAICLPPYRAIVLFTGDAQCMQADEGGQEHVTKYSVTGPYEVSVALEKEYPCFRTFRTFECLRPINSADLLPRFSGHIRYNFTVRLPESAQNASALTLDLGNCGETACATVNGVFAGTQIVPPYRFEATGLLGPGDNRLEVIISNHLGWELRDYCSKYMLFEPSGLLGPVTIEAAHQGRR